MANNQKRLTRQLFEAIVFLKLNERFRTTSTVSEQISQMRQDGLQDKIRAHLWYYVETEWRIKISIDLW